MAPTPMSHVPTAPPMTGFWAIVGFVGLTTLLLVIGLITGHVQFNPQKGRESARRGVMTMDALFSTPEKQAAIEYIRDEEHLIEFEREGGEGDGNDEEGAISIQGPGKGDDAPD